MGLAYRGYLGASPPTRTVLARRIARNMFWLMAGSMCIGSYVLDFFGISLPIVRIGGGLILSSVAWRLLGATPTTPDSPGQRWLKYSHQTMRCARRFIHSLFVLCGDITG